MLPRLLLCMIWLNFLAGCSVLSRDDGDEPAAVAELQRIEHVVRLENVWSASVGGDDEQFLNLVPAFDGERIYVADHKGQVKSLDARTGKKIWLVKTGKQISGGPGVAEGVVLLGTGNGEVIALDAGSGNELWTAIVTGEVLSIPRAAIGMAAIQTLSGDLVGLDLSTGVRRWIYDRSVPTLSLRGTGSPALYGDVVVGGFASGKLSVIAIDSGRTIWEGSIAVPRGRSELERMVDIDASPVVKDGIVYAVSFQGKVAAVELETGKIIWARDMSSSAGLGVDASHVYVVDEESILWAISRRNGAPAWKQDALRGRSLTAPIMFDGNVVVADAEGYLHVLSALDGTILGRERVERDGVRATPVTGNDMLYVLGRGGKLVAYRTKSLSSGKKK